MVSLRAPAAVGVNVTEARLHELPAFNVWLVAQAEEVGVVRTKSAVFPEVVDKVVPKTMGAELAVTAAVPVQATLVPTPVDGHVTPLVVTTTVP